MMNQVYVFRIGYRNHEANPRELIDIVIASELPILTKRFHPLIGGGMKGFQLEFFTEQSKRHGHRELWSWLLDLARAQGIRGATVFMGAMGYGHHRRMHSAHFFELADQPVEVTMVVSESEADQFFAVLEKEGVHLFYVKLPVEFGTLGEAVL